MANHYVPETPTFNAGVRKFETTDRNHADTLNVPIAQLVENDNYLKKELEKKANQEEQNKIYTVSELSGQSLKNAKMYFVKVQRGQTVTQIGQYSIFKENNAQTTSLKGGTNTDKVYSLYFDSSKNGFFLRASATGTAAADHVLAGKTFSSETNTDQTGTMINRGNWGATLDTAGQIVVPNGYHDGTGIVKANTISGRTIMPGQNEQLVIEAGKLATGDIRVSGDSNLIPANIRQGTNIFGISGTYDGGRSQIANALTNKGIPTSTTATPEQIVQNINKLSTFDFEKSMNTYLTVNFSNSYSAEVTIEIPKDSLVWYRNEYGWSSSYGRIQTQIIQNDIPIYPTEIFSAYLTQETGARTQKARLIKLNKGRYTIRATCDKRITQQEIILFTLIN